MQELLPVLQEGTNGANSESMLSTLLIIASERARAPHASHLSAHQALKLAADVAYHTAWRFDTTPAGQSAQREMLLRVITTAFMLEDTTWNALADRLSNLNETILRAGLREGIETGERPRERAPLLLYSVLIHEAERRMRPDETHGRAMGEIGARSLDGRSPLLDEFLLAIRAHSNGNLRRMIMRAQEEADLEAAVALGLQPQEESPPQSSFTEDEDMVIV